MKIIKDPIKERKLIESIIDKYGYTPDHNFDWLRYCSDIGSPRVAIWENEYALWCYQNKEDWIVVSDPIAPTDKHKELLNEFIRNIFVSDANIITFFDLRDGVHDIVRDLYPANYKSYYSIVWPVVEINSFDPELIGGRFKDIRNALNKFNREHEVEVKTANSVNKKDLGGIVDRWLDNRTKSGIEELFPNRYHSMIGGSFRGTDSARVMFVDGKAVGFNAGWGTPNTSEQWAATVGIHDFSTKDLGVALLMEDLVWIKNAGYKTCDLGGSDPKALRFKTQFFSSFNTYKTSTFWLYRI